LEARRKGWSVRFEPLPTEKTGSFAFGGRGVRHGERFDDWKVFVVIIHCKPVSAIVEERVLEIHICSHVRNCQIVDGIRVYSNMGE
jgi:hypothetical protein